MLPEISAIALLTDWGSIPFSRDEFACNCGCGFNVVDCELLAVLVDLREKFGRVNITGPNRCLLHNEVVQKKYNRSYVPFSSRSYHMKGLAVDAKFPHADVKKVYTYLCDKYPSKYGFILYHNRIHIDVRPWEYREEK